MQEINITAIVETIDQAIEALTAFYGESLPEIKAISEKEFEDSAHNAAGMFIRDSWYLWWHEGHNIYTWPRQKPALVKLFNELGVVSPDLMSSFLLACFYEKVNNR